MEKILRNIFFLHPKQPKITQTESPSRHFRAYTARLIQGSQTEANNVHLADERYRLRSQINSLSHRFCTYLHSGNIAVLQTYKILSIYTKNVVVRVELQRYIINFLYTIKPTLFIIHFN